jgi:hypothetical protein
MNREEEIRKIAYHMWDLEGRPEGHSLEYWLMAESIWEINHKSDSGAKTAWTDSQPLSVEIKYEGQK